MNILFIGDVVGQNGLSILEKRIYKLKREYEIDITVINGENSAVGNGIDRASLERLISLGADVVTGGNHSFKQVGSFELHETSSRLIRPANYPEGAAGRGVCLLDMPPVKIAVINLLGTTGLEPLENPFGCIDRILEKIDTPNIFVDLHAEATSEKKALGQYHAGRVTAVIGTHTHVQTADETILNDHTAYITDVGMTGAELSVLGVDSKKAIERFRFRTPVRFEESANPGFINGAAVSFDEKLGKAYKITRIIMR